jgi:hypothetical protein
MPDWYKTSAGDDCAWCGGGPDYEPFDSDDADARLCRGHVAEFEGLSLAGLDRMESEMRKDLE